MNITTTFTSTQRHGAFVALFSVVILSEVVLFMISGFVYINMTIKYNNAVEAKQNQVNKEMQIKDTEYEEILKQENETISGGPKQRGAGINNSVVDSDDEDD